MRLGMLAALAICSCSAEAQPPRVEKKPSPPVDRGDRVKPNWDEAVARIAAKRVALARAWREAPDDASRQAVSDLASRVLVTALRDELMPQWLGMAWGLGANSTATRPFEPDHTIACSYFVGAILAGADFRLHDRFKLGQ